MEQHKEASEVAQLLANNDVLDLFNVTFSVDVR